MRLKERVQTILNGITGRHCSIKKIKEWARRVCSIMLCTSMVAGSMPISAITAFAADDEDTEPDYIYEIDSICIDDNTSLNEPLKNTMAFLM